MGGRAAPDNVPNWFYYWSQIKRGVAAAGDTTFTFRPATAGEVESQHGLSFAGPPLRITRSEIVIHPNDADSLSGYIGILEHEQTHENDFWATVWAGAGYNAADDRDHDLLKDDWERTQVMATGTGYGPWTFNIPAYDGKPAVVGTLAADDDDVTIESTAAVKSWSDARADVAAVAATNANLAVDEKDWSDHKNLGWRSLRLLRPRSCA